MTVRERDPAAMTEDEYDAWNREMDEPDELDDPGDAYDAWREWRVHFKDAEDMSTRIGFESDLTPKLYNEDFVAAYTDRDGVFDLESAFRAYVGSR